MEICLCISDRLEVEQECGTWDVICVLKRVLLMELKDISLHPYARMILLSWW